MSEFRWPKGLKFGGLFASRFQRGYSQRRAHALPHAREAGLRSPVRWFTVGLNVGKEPKYSLFLGKRSERKNDATREGTFAAKSCADRTDHYVVATTRNSRCGNVSVSARGNTRCGLSASRIGVWSHSKYSEPRLFGTGG